MIQQIKKPAVTAIFGEYYGNKLINSLNNCCSSPAISINMTATCGEVDPKSGNQTYNINASATYNTSIQGYTTLIGYFSSQQFTNWTAVTNDTLDNLKLNSGSIVVSNITANTPIVLANLVSKNMTPGTYYALVTDNKGNYSNYLTVNIPDCGNDSTSTTAAQNTKDAQGG